MKRRLIVIVAVVLVSVATFYLLWPRATVESVMEDFYCDDAGRAEDMLMDPLILHADLVKSRVIEEVAARTMPKRRYAIGFLGVAGITDALPVLRMILADETEKGFFRADALESIYQIAKEDGLALASQYQSRTDHLGSIAKGLIDGSHKPLSRSYAQAVVGHHE
ncbi:MAG: hypothetical protein ACO34E_10120 [Limisphaerales bacterium]